MYYSQQFLRRYLSLDVDAPKIAEELTLKSCEVEELHERKIPDLVVIGKVLSVVPHPNADKLVICQTDCGSHGKFQICTGAVNMVEGYYVPVALPGTHLPSINLTIEPRQMRGEDSNGMICSKEELGIAHDIGEHSIWTLQGKYMRIDPGHEDDLTAGAFDDISEKDIGMKLSDKYPWLEGWILDVENKTITHRPDMFGHFGLALELRTIFSDKVGFHRITQLLEKMNPGHILQILENAKQGSITTTVTSPYVLSYCTIELGSITVGASSFFTKLQLIDSGLQPKNNWVDFSNSFMLTTGQPIHFFDAKKVTGGITVRQAKEGEKFTDLFETDHTLTINDIVIADQEKILALAGIVGSNNSGIDENTTDIIVEIANFDAVVVRKTATRIGLRTDAEIRYEKYINPMYSLAAVELFMDELAYAKPSLGNYEMNGVTSWFANSDISVQKRIEVSWEHIYSLIYGNSEMNEGFVAHATKILTNLGCTVSGNTVISPLWRSPDDLNVEADIVEEIARIIGFNTIEEVTLSNNSGFVEFLNPTQILRETEDYLLKTHKLNQVETYPWLDKQWLPMAKTHQAELFSLKNPLNPEQSTLRYTMIWDLLAVVQKNAAFFDSLHVFDYGKVWNKKREKQEHDMLCIALYDKDPSDLNHPLRKAKEIVNGVLEVRDVRGKLDYTATTYDFAHPKQQGTISLNNTVIGTVMSVHPAVLESVKIGSGSTVTILELDYTIIESLLPEKKKQKKWNYESVTDQIIYRDLNFVLDKGLPYGLISNALLKCKEIDDLQIFDLYAGETLPKGKKSCAVRIKIKGDGTMTTEQINDVMQKAITSVEKSGGALRE